MKDDLLEFISFLHLYLLKKNFMNEMTLKKIEKAKSIILESDNDNKKIIRLLEKKFLQKLNINKFSTILKNRYYLKEFLLLYILEDYLNEKKNIKKIDVKVIYEM